MPKVSIKSRYVATPWGRMHMLESGSAPQDVIFLHGWNNDAWSCRKVLETLSSTYHVIVPTLPGSHPSMSLYGSATPELLATILAYWFDQLSLRTPIVIGHSFGGLCAMLLSAKRQSIIKKVVLCNSAGIPIVQPSTLWVLRWLGHRPTLYRTHGFAVMRMLDRSLLKQFIFRFRDFLSLAFMAKKTHIADSVPKIEIPITIAWGVDDTFMQVSQAEGLHRLYPTSTLVTFPGDHYWPVMDPGRFFTLIKQ